jgi:hypothetical protein
MRRDGSEQVPLMIALTSGQGKISALACHRSSTGVRLVAIERHFEVSRVLRFPVDNETASGKMITPRILLDMQPTPDGRLPNYEGILWENDGWWMISDNHYGRITGPTDVLHLGDGPAP